MAPKTSPRRMIAEKRRKEAFAMRLSGARLRQISDKLGVSVQRVSKILEESLIEARGELSKDIERLRALELERLNTLRIALWPRAVGRMVRDGDTVHQEPPDYSAIDRVVKISERISKLAGLDAPSRCHIGGEVDNSVHVGFTDETIAKIRAEVLGIKE